MLKFLPILLVAGALAGCANDADVASRNLSNDADNFKINRRIVFYNGINGEYLLEVRGLCSMDNAKTGRYAISVTCKDNEGLFVKHFLGLSDNVTYFAEQLKPAKVGTSMYQVTFKPSVIIPDVTLR